MILDLTIQKLWLLLTPPKPNLIFLRKPKLVGISQKRQCSTQWTLVVNSIFQNRWISNLKKRLTHNKSSMIIWLKSTIGEGILKKKERTWASKKFCNTKNSFQGNLSSTGMSWSKLKNWRRKSLINSWILPKKTQQETSSTLWKLLTITLAKTKAP